MQAASAVELASGDGGGGPGGARRQEGKRRSGCQQLGVRRRLEELAVVKREDGRAFESDNGDSPVGSRNGGLGDDGVDGSGQRRRFSFVRCRLPVLLLRQERRECEQKNGEEARGSRAGFHPWAECSIEGAMAFARRDEFVWHLRTRSLELGRRTLVMGVLNVTPDSFSDGNLFLDSKAATAQALRMFDEGADIVDIGGESTRPGKYDPVTVEDEQRRVLPVIEAVLKARPGSVLSIDTYKASTAAMAVEAGAEIVNDISALNWDAEMAATCARLACGVVMMHTRGKPAEWRSLPPSCSGRGGAAGEV